VSYHLILKGGQNGSDPPSQSASHINHESTPSPQHLGAHRALPIFRWLRGRAYFLPHFLPPYVAPQTRVNFLKSVDLGERARRAREHKVFDLGERARPILVLFLKFYYG